MLNGWRRDTLQCNRDKFGPLSSKIITSLRGRFDLPLCFTRCSVCETNAYKQRLEPHGRCCPKSPDAQLLQAGEGNFSCCVGLL